MTIHRGYKSPMVPGLHAYPTSQYGQSQVETPYVHQPGSHIGLAGATQSFSGLGLGGVQMHETVEQDPNYRAGYTQGYAWVRQHPQANTPYASQQSYQGYTAAIEELKAFKAQGFVEAFIQGWLAGYVDAVRNKPPRF